MPNRYFALLKNMSTRKSISKPLIHQKSKAILADLARLNTLLRDIPIEDLQYDEEKLTIAERRLERIINRAIDINFHLIRALDAPPPDDYTQSFRMLGTLKIIPAKLASEIAPAAGSRNILIHEYDELDYSQFFSALKAAVRLFPRYLKAIERFAEKQRR